MDDVLNAVNKKSYVDEIFKINDFKLLSNPMDVDYLVQVKDPVSGQMKY